MSEIGIHSSLLWITAILILSFDIIVFLGSNVLSSRIFAIFSSLVALWSISYGFLVVVTSPTTALSLIRLNHFIGIIISLGFVYFSLTYPHNETIKRSTKTRLILLAVPFIFLFFFSNLMIPSMYPLSSPDKWGWNTGPLYFTYSIVFNLLWLFTLLNIFRHIKYLKRVEDRINQRFMFWGLTIGILPPSLLNIVLPTFGIYGYSWTGPIASAIWIFIIGYSIIRYRQMNVRVIITEMLAVAMTVIFFINIFIQAQFGTLENIFTFFVFLLLAIYLIRGVLVETKQKDQLRDLNDNLEHKVTEQTLEIRHSYDLEKQARRELEKLNEAKDQFIILTQHSLRSPLYNIQADINKLTNKPRNSEDEKIHYAIGNSLSRLTKVVNDFLSISAIRDGNNILNLSSENPKDIVIKVINELSFDLSQKNISINYSDKNSDWPTLNIDQSKIHDTLVIVIENSIKYGKRDGKISIVNKVAKGIFTLIIEDNGIGISKTDLNKINSNLFFRSIQAKNNNPIGMGVGLSVARSIIKAHHGDLVIYSSGENRGTTVTISLPINFTL